MPQRPLAPGETVFGYLLLLIGCLTFYFAVRISGFSSVSSPGVFPMLGAAVMIGASVAIILRNLGASRASPPGDMPRSFFREIAPARIAIMIAMIVAYILLLDPIGFIVASFGFLFAAILYLERGNPIFAALISAACIGAVYFVFRTLFTVVLPKGWFWS